MEKAQPSPQPGTAKKLRVLIQQPVLAPYRDAIFMALASHPELDVQFLASDKSLTGEVLNTSAPLPKKVVGFRKFKGGLVWQNGLVEELRNGNYDVLSVGYNPHFLSSIAAVLRGRKQGVAIVMWGHGVRGQNLGLKEKIYRQMGQWADALVFYSEEGAAVARNSGLPESKIYVATNSLDTAKIAELREDKSFEDRSKILCIGRLTEAKKVDLAIRAFAAAKPRLRPDVRLSIVGDGSCREQFQNLCEQLGISSSVEFAGAIYEEDVIAPFMNDSYVSLSPGYVGLSAIHSLAYGIPMIYTRDEKHSPEVEALTEGKNSLVVPSDDPEALAAAMVRLDQDRELACKMGRDGISVVEKSYSTEAMTESLLSAFRAARSQKSR